MVTSEKPFTDLVVDAIMCDVSYSINYSQFLPLITYPRTEQDWSCTDAGI